MARRRKKDYEDALEFLIKAIILIPIAAIAIIKWVFKALAWLCVKLDYAQKQKLLRSESIGLENVYQMDGLTFEH